jgi:hypothetical protein
VSRSIHPLASLSLLPFLFATTRLPAQAPAARPTLAPEASRARTGETREATPEERRAEAEGYRIGRVSVVTEDIFDPARDGEDLWVFRLADRLHVTTRRQTIEHQLLFHPGDRFTVQALAESERLLRATRYLYDARIRATRIGDGTVDLEVVTRDVWTLQGGIAYRHAGGTSRTRFSVTDENFFGTGKAFDVEHTRTVDRTSNLAQYRDGNLAGSRAQLQLLYAKNSDGHLEQAQLERPFYSLDTRWAAGGSGSQNDFVDSLYQNGHIFDSFRERHDFAEVYGGLSPGLVDDAARRIRFGLTFDRTRFDLAPGAVGGSPPAILPRDRTLAYPWVSLEYVGNGYVVARDLDRIERSEDLNLGPQAFVRLGWSAPLFGGDVSRLVASAGISQGWHPGPRQLLLAGLSASTRTRRGEIDNGLVSGSLRYYLRDLGDNLLFANLVGVLGKRLDPDAQLLLGGDNGLRGYPFRYRAGDRLWLASVEQRFFSPHEYFHLVHLGAAAFFDVGQAWFASQPPGVPPQPKTVLDDVGLGLRIGSSRSAQGSLVHLDLAFPLNRADRSIKRVQWLVSTSETF